MRSIALLSVVAALGVVACSRAPVTEERARRTAEDTFAQTCRSFGLNPSDYRGPISNSVGGAAFAYEWLHRQKVDHGMLISVREDGWDQVAFLQGGP